MFIPLQIAVLVEERGFLGPFRDVQEWLATFPSVHSHSHDASDLLSIPVPLQKFFPILSHSHLTNERHLLLNKR